MWWCDEYSVFIFSLLSLPITSYTVIITDKDTFYILFKSWFSVN